MVEEANTRVRNGMQEFVQNIDKNHLRNMERDMHLCAVECCSNQTANLEEVMNCKQKCEVKLDRAQKYVQTELERFLESSNRCGLSCQDDIMDKVTPNTPEAEIEKYRTEFNSCLIKCSDTSVAKLPALSKKVTESLKSGKI